MKVIRFHQHGGPEVLVYEDAPEPQLAPGEVLVRIRASALIRIDVWGRRGRPGLTIPMPHIPGSDAAGEIVSSAGVEVSPGRIKVPAQNLVSYKQDIVREIDRLTNRRGVDVVIEHVGQATWARSVASLARVGRLSPVARSRAPAPQLIYDRFSPGSSRFPDPMGSKGELMRAARFFFAGQLDPVIDRTFPLADAAPAPRHLEEGKPFGKVVLEV